MTEEAKVIENAEEKAIKIELPLYMQVESGTKGSIFDLRLEDLIFEKMFLIFEKQMPIDEKLFTAECNLQTAKDKIISETDFSEVLGKSRTNQAERDAYMKPLLETEQKAVDELKDKVKFYTNKIVIINDLIKAKRTALKIEAELI